MTANGPRILLIGGTYRALCVLERLLERGDRIAGFIAVEGSGSERDFCPEILEICDRSQIPARSGHKLGEEITRWLEDRIRPELAIAVGVGTEIPVAVGGNCRHGLLEVIDFFHAESCPGVILRQRGQVVLERELARPDENDDAGDAYLRMLDEVLTCLEDYLDQLAPPPAERPERICFRAAPQAAESLGELSARPDPGPETDALERDLCGYLGADHVLALRSPIDAWRVLLRGLELDPSDRVVVPGIVSAAALGALREGDVRHTFADVTADRLTVSPERVEVAVDATTRVLLVSHALGQPAELDRLYGIAEERGLELIEDGGEGLGGRFDGSRLGRTPSSCVFRMPVVDGTDAAVVTLSPALAERVAPFVGELRVGDGLAARLRANLETLDDRIALRQQNASALSAELSRYDAFRVPATPENALPTYAAYMLRITRFARTSADDLGKLLGEAGIETRRLRVPLRERDLAGLPATEMVRSTGVLLPVCDEIGEEQRDRMLDAIFGYAIG